MLLRLRQNTQRCIQTYKNLVRHIRWNVLQEKLKAEKARHKLGILTNRKDLPDIKGVPQWAVFVEMRANPAILTKIFVLGLVGSTSYFALHLYFTSVKTIQLKFSYLQCPYNIKSKLATPLAGCIYTEGPFGL